MLHKDLFTRLCQARDALGLAHQSSVAVAQVATGINMSTYHFIRLYKAVFGETPNQYQMRLRLDMAKRLLISSDCSITDVCMEVGYSSLGTFSELFSQRVGMTPTAYRQKFRPLVDSSGQLPKLLIPCCFSLMAGSSDSR